MSGRTFAVALILLAPLAGSGCSPTIKKPQLLHPGPAPVQRYNATQFDPYPPPDLGPEIVGGRPPDYLAPVPEVERARQFRDSHPPIPGAIPAPGLSGAPTPVVIPTLPPASAPAPPPVEYRY